MKKKYFFIYLVFLLFIDKENSSIEGQKAQERIWKSIYLIKEYSLGLTQGLLNPLKAKFDNRDFIYILDIGDLTIKKFSADGQFIQKFGKGRGQGPGEFLNITDFDIRDNGEIWVCDPILGYITIFDIDGIPIKTYRTKEPPYRIGLQKTGLFVVIPSFFLDSLPFSVYDQKGEIGLTFNLQPPWKEKFPSSLFLKMDGWLSVDVNNCIYYAFTRVGMVACFSPRGNLRYLIETIDRTPPPEVLTSKGIIRLDPASPWTAGSISLDESKFYLLSLVGSKNRKGSIIDVYRSQDGFYLYSFEIPEKCSSAYVKEKSIVTVSEGFVTKWKMVTKK